MFSTPIPHPRPLNWSDSFFIFSSCSLPTPLPPNPSVHLLVRELPDLLQLFPPPTPTTTTTHRVHLLVREHLDLLQLFSNPPPTPDSVHLLLRKLLHLLQLFSNPTHPPTMSTYLTPFPSVLLLVRELLDLLQPFSFHPQCPLTDQRTS